MLGISLEDLVKLYEYSRISSRGATYLDSPPTKKSLAMIKKAIGCDLPTGFVRFAQACPSYTEYFVLLGEDVEAVGFSYEPHILFAHQFAPEGFVPLVQRQDYYFLYEKSNPEGAIYNLEEGYFNTDDDSVVPEQIVEVAPSFTDFLEDFIIGIARGGRDTRGYREREEFVTAVLAKYS
jgi:hypothetical protein